MSEWQPIETAPTDGTAFLTYTPMPDDSVFSVDVAYWDEESGDLMKFGCGFMYVTHWMPIPEPPQ